MLLNDSIVNYFSSTGTDYPWITCPECGNPFPYYDGKLHEWKNGLIKEHTHKNNTPIDNNSGITIMLFLVSMYLLMYYLIKHVKSLKHK